MTTHYRHLSIIIAALSRVAARRSFSHVLSLFLCLCGAGSAYSQTIDTVIFGNSTSEGAHNLTTAFGAVTPASVVAAGNGTTPSNPSSTPPSQTTSGALGQSGRQLLPRTPNADVYGGQMTFTVTVDSVKQNYLTMKFWGGDTNEYIWLVLDCNGHEVGARHSDNFEANFEGEILWHYSLPWYPNRWVYRAVALPLNLTVGQTSATITIRSLGEIEFYASGAYFGDYQKLMASASPVMYEAVVHTSSYFDSSSETQGTQPTPLTPLTTPTASATISSIESTVNSTAASYLNATPSSLTPDQIDYLAETYGTSWSTYSGSSAIVTQVVAAIDALTTAYAAAPTTYMGDFVDSSWGGYFGPAGDAIRRLWPQINTGTTMSTTVAYGGSLGTVSRTTAWSTALRASVDYGRFNRRSYTNQGVTCDVNIYLANRALELVQASNGLLETQALRYLHEAAGIIPWTGSDQAGEGQTPVVGTSPNGPNWYIFTTNGLSKETGMVGSDYGEQGGILYRMGLIAGDTALQARALKIYQARDYFRYTGTDSNGYLIMLGPEPVGDRNGNDIPGHTAYLGRDSADDFLAASQGAAAIGANLLGYFQQGVNEGQALLEAQNSSYGNTLNGSSQLPLLPDYWATASTQPETGVLLPQTNNAGLSDFAWADEQNMVVSAKHGSGASEENFYANLNWKAPNYINGMAKVFDLTPTQARDADVKLQDEQFVSAGITRVGSNVADNVQEPWDNPTMATAGVPFNEAIRSDLTTLPSTNEDGGRGTGYTLRWGHWLVGMNAYQTSTGTPYAMQMPSDFVSGTDLISGQTYTGQVTLQPQTAVVFYMAESVDPDPVPGPVLYFAGGGGGNGQVPLTWTAAPGATSYSVLRSTTSGGPYSLVADDITQLQYNDATVTNRTTYYYIVVADNAAGLTGSNSPQVSATPSGTENSGLPAPWSNTDVGTVGATGSATYNSGTFTLTGSGTDIWGDTDGFQFVHAPLVASGSITVKVVSQQNTHSYARAGIMVRQSLSSGDLDVNLILTPTNGVFMNKRVALNGGSSTVASLTGIAAPYWLRLAYSAPDTFTGYISPDGVTWTQLGTTNLGRWAGSPAFIGLADTSQHAGVLSTDVFSNVTLSGVPTDSVAAVPTGLTATAGVGLVNLQWTAVSGATGYNVKRSTTSGGPYTSIAADTTSVAYIDTTAVAGTTYYYAVSSLNSVGESANSAQVSTTPSYETQTISFSAPASSVTYGTAPISLSATASSGLAVSFTVVSGPASVSGSALTILGAGTVVVAASQSGNATYSAAPTVTISLTVLTDPTAVVLQASPTTTDVGQTAQFTATVTPVAATGTMSFFDGVNSLGSSTISGGAATFSTTGLIGGSHSITAHYSGGTDYASAVSSAVIVSVTDPSLIPTSISLQASPTTSEVGQSVQLTATLAPAAATGTVSFLDQGNSLGTATTINGMATFTTTTLSSGSHSITADYVGSATYAAAISTAQTVTVSGAADFSLSTTVTSVQMNAGSSITIPFTVSPLDGFDQPVTLSCSVPNVAVVCSFASSVVKTANGVVATEVVVQYPAVVAGASSGKIRVRDPEIPLSGIGLFISASATARRRRFGATRKLRLALLALFSLAVVTGCGSGAHTQDITQDVAHTLTITATSGQISHTLSVILDVTAE